MRALSVLDLVGNTPVVRINSLFSDFVTEVWMKLERSNPGNSIKDRIAVAMIEAAERDGSLGPDSTIIEPTSGNTGIGLAMVAAVKGYRLVLVMPESMSIERRRVMAAFGAELILTPKEKGMKGAIELAFDLLRDTPKGWMPMQFDNPANTEVHRNTTCSEICNDFPDGLDAIITGVGTGGHITACGEILKNHFSGLKLFAVEPERSPVLSGGAASPHRIQGIGAGFIPSIMRTELLDGIITVSEEEAFNYSNRAAKEEGLLIGISSGASLAAVSKYLKTQRGSSIPKKLLTFCYDTGERYLSIDDLFTTVAVC